MSLLSLANLSAWIGPSHREMEQITANRRCHQTVGTQTITPSPYKVEISALFRIWVVTTDKSLNQRYNVFFERGVA